MPKEPKSYAPRISPSMWEQHRCRITTFFVDQKEPLRKVAEIMKTCGLHASESQYERQLKAWGMRKNRTRDEWRLINRVVQKRRRQGKYSVVFINGAEQPREKLEREFARSGYREHGGGLDHSLPEDIQVISPPRNDFMTDRIHNLWSSEYGTSSRVSPWFKNLWCQFFSQTVDPALSTFMRILQALSERQNSRSRFLLTAPDPELPLPLRLESPFIDMPDYGSRSDIIMRDRSPSPSGSWGIPSWHSTDVTSEEWVSRGWDVFFGGWR